jgi:hypothetical protein
MKILRPAFVSEVELQNFVSRFKERRGHLQIEPLLTEVRLADLKKNASAHTTLLTASPT